MTPSADQLHSANRRPWLAALFSVLCSAMLVAAAVCTGPISEINDDAGVQWILGTIGDYSPYQHPALSVLIRGISFLWPGLCWFVIAQFFVLFLALWAMLWAVYCLGGVRACPLGWTICASAMWCGALKVYTFTRTGPALLAAGCMIAICVILKKHSFFSGILISNLLLLLGMMFRYEGVLAVFPFFILLGVLVTARRAENVKTWLWNIVKDGKALWLSLALCVAVMGCGRLYMSFVPGWEDYLQFDMARGQIQDFESQDRWGQSTERYQALGLSEIDFKMIQNWNTEDTDVFTTELMQEIAECRHISIHFDHWVDTLKDSAGKSGLWLVAFASLFAAAVAGINGLLYAIMGSGGFALLVLFQMFTGRIVPRSLDALFMGFLFGAVCVYCLRLPAAKLLNCLLTLLCGIICLIPSWQNHGRPALPSLSYGTVPSRVEALERITADSEHIYLLTCSAGMYPDQFCGMWGALPGNEKLNLYWLGDCYMRAPKVRQKLAEMGIDNPIKAVFTDNRVISNRSRTLLEYLQTRYDPDINCEILFDMGFFEAARYTSSKTIAEEIR